MLLQRIGLFVCVLTIAACGLIDPNCSPNPSPETGLLGDYVWLRSQGGLGGFKINPATDSTVTLKLAADSTYSVYLNNQLSQSGRFSVVGTNTSDSGMILHFERGVRAHKLDFLGDESFKYVRPDSCVFQDYQVGDGYAHIFKHL